MSVPTYERCPPGWSNMQYSMFLEDRCRDIPAVTQPSFPEDHSRREWLAFERDCLRGMRALTPEAATDVYVAMVAAKRHPELLPGVESALRLQMRVACVSRDDVLCFLEVFTNGRTDNN